MNHQTSTSGARSPAIYHGLPLKKTSYESPPTTTLAKIRMMSVQKAYGKNKKWREPQPIKQHHKDTIALQRRRLCKSQKDNNVEQRCKYNAKNVSPGNNSATI
eukprot:TRINITY_DN70703_c0_g1_i1.p2 TRINITY_DN70703_c0_g1~~TRINITY_DN70703_c0_g1_i1.p2  ORF type:complete len:103 (+),score=10.77 TRINITY_DN70703_c0_g1_i1:45-353(+)